jgi:hypothetical protein
MTDAGFELCRNSKSEPMMSNSHGTIYFLDREQEIALYAC